MHQEIKLPPSLLKSIGVFIFIFVLLSLPWPGLQKTYSSCFQGIGTTLFSSDHGPRDVVFLKHPEHVTLPSMVRIEIANRRWLSADGSGPVRHLDLDVHGFALLPTMLLIALVFATPLPTNKRIVSLVSGLLLMQLVVIGFLALAIWNESAQIGLVNINPEWKTIMETTIVNVVTHFSIAAPIAIWVLVCLSNMDKITNPSR